MERASLRPVPHRPEGPVEPAEALAHVQAQLPGLDGAAHEALALVELVGRTRPQIVAETQVHPAELGVALARARKALRRAAFPLPGSGWCERAERLLSDELDGALEDPGPRRLAAHLANCDRCVEHERRLWHARDRLVASFEEERAPAVTPAPAPSPEPPPADEPDTEAPEIPEPELRLVVETPAPADPVPADPEPAEPPPAAAEAPVPVALTQPRSLAGLAWAALMAIAVLLAVATIALTAYAIAGGGI